MDAKEYIEQRVEDQLSWYDNSSQKNQRRHKLTRIIEMASASMIPFLSGASSSLILGISVSWIIGALGVVIAFTAAFSQLQNYQENWIKYRTVSEALRTEKYRFQTDSSPYNGQDKFGRFVEKIESLLNEESNQWHNAMQQEASEEHKLNKSGLPTEKSSTPTSAEHYPSTSQNKHLDAPHNRNPDMEGQRL